jgi:hypothetical protein
MGAAISGTNSPAPVSTTLAAGAQLPIVDNQLFGPGNAAAVLPAWGKIASSVPQLAGFFLTFNRNLTSMDGADLSQAPMPFSVLPEIGDQDFTRIFLANPNSSDASVSIDLVGSDGTVRKTVNASITALGTYFGDLKTDVFPGIALDPSDYVRVTSDKGLLHYESFGGVSGDIAVLAGQDLTKGAGTLYAPQYVVGGPWRSTLSIVNLGLDPGSVTLRLVGEDGTQIGNTRTLTISGGGKIYVSDQSFFGGSSAGSPALPVQGYVEVTASGMWLSGSVVFGDANRGTFSASMPLISTLHPAMVLSQVASNATYFTGVAIVNPSGSSVTATVDLHSADGTLLNTVEQIIPAGQRRAQLLTEYFPGIMGQDLHSGYIKVTANQGVACFGVFGTHDLSVLSAIPASPIQ